jgi:hypothetical protein
MNTSRYVYVIMPVASDPSFPTKRAVLDRAIRSTGLVPRFPAYLPHRPTFVLASVMEDIRGAASVVADVSLERPNCCYEIGVAEAIGQRVHLIARQGTPIHQSMACSQVRYYRDLEDLAHVVAMAPRESALLSDAHP